MVSRKFYGIFLIVLINSPQAVSAEKCRNTFLTTPIEHFDLSPDTKQALKKKGAENLGDFLPIEVKIRNNPLSQLKILKEMLERELEQLNQGGINPDLAYPIESLNLSTDIQDKLLGQRMLFSLKQRMFFSLKKVYYIGDLVTLTEQDLKRLGLSREAIAEIKNRLSERDLHLNMNINWPEHWREVKKLVQKLKPKITSINLWKKLRKSPLSPREIVSEEWILGLRYHHALVDIFSEPIKELDLSLPYEDKLNEEGINYIGDLLVKTEQELKETFKDSLLINAINTRLSERGLSLDWLEPYISEPETKRTIQKFYNQDNMDSLLQDLNDAMDFYLTEELAVHFIQSIESLDLTTSIEDTLKKEGIDYIGDLVRLIERDLRDFGLSIDDIVEIKDRLSGRKLHLRMVIGWPENSEQKEALVKRLTPLPDLPLEALDLPPDIKKSLKKKGVFNLGDFLTMQEKKLTEREQLEILIKKLKKELRERMIEESET